MRRKSMFALIALVAFSLAGGLYLAHDAGAGTPEAPEAAETPDTQTLPATPVGDDGGPVVVCPYKECPGESCVEQQIALVTDSGLTECYDIVNSVTVTCTGGQTVHYGIHNCGASGKCATAHSWKPIGGSYPCQ